MNGAVTEPRMQVYAFPGRLPAGASVGFWFKIGP